MIVYLQLTNYSPHHLYTTHLGYASRELTSAHVQEEREKCRRGGEGRGGEGRGGEGRGGEGRGGEGRGGEGRGGEGRGGEGRG